MQEISPGNYRFEEMSHGDEHDSSSDSCPVDVEEYTEVKDRLSDKIDASPVPEITTAQHASAAALNQSQS